jgi:hypothetical protein
MCPACLASAAMVAAGATSASGLTLLAVKKIWTGRREPLVSESADPAPAAPKGGDDGSSEHRVA